MLHAGGADICGHRRRSDRSYPWSPRMTPLQSSFNGIFLRLHVRVTEMDLPISFSHQWENSQVQGPAFRPGRRGWSCHFKEWSSCGSRSLLSLPRVTSPVLGGDELGTQSESFPLVPVPIPPNQVCLLLGRTWTWRLSSLCSLTPLPEEKQPRVYFFSSLDDVEDTRGWVHFEGVPTKEKPASLPDCWERGRQHVGTSRRKPRL